MMFLDFFLVAWSQSGYPSSGTTEAGRWNANKIKLLVNEKPGGLDTLWGIFHRVVAVATCPPEFRLSSVSRNILHVLDITYGFIAVDKAAGSWGDMFVRCSECFQDVNASDLVRPSSLSLPFLSVPRLPPLHAPLFPVSSALRRKLELCPASVNITHAYGFATSPAYEQNRTHTQRLPHCTCWIIFGVTNGRSLGENGSLNASQRHEKRLIYDKMKDVPLCIQIRSLSGLKRASLSPTPESKSAQCSMTSSQ